VDVTVTSISVAGLIPQGGPLADHDDLETFNKPAVSGINHHQGLPPCTAAAILTLLAQPELFQTSNKMGFNNAHMLQ
jgi:hypothetical protein